MPPSLTDLDAFAAVARHRSFRGAARERGVSPALLSQTLRRLEEQLGVRLLHRTTRSVTLTQAGELLLADLAPALAGVSAALESLNQLKDHPAGRLRLNAPLPVVHLLLAPRVGEFLRTYPDIALEITADDALVDVLGQGYDAGIRFGEDLATDMVAVPLPLPRQRQVVATPAYWARWGYPAHPRDLAKHRRIGHRFPNGSLYNWEFSRNEERYTLTPGGSLVTNDPWLEVDAALGEGGCAWIFADYAQGPLAEGRLESVLDDWCPPQPAPCIYYASHRQLPPPLRAFIDFFKSPGGPATAARSGP